MAALKSENESLEISRNEFKQTSEKVKSESAKMKESLEKESVELSQLNESIQSLTLNLATKAREQEEQAETLAALREQLHLQTEESAAV